MTQDLTSDNLVWDLETNGLLKELDRIHVMCIGNCRTDEVITYTDNDPAYPSLSEGITRLSNHISNNAVTNRRCIVAHNGIGFDRKAMLKVTGLDIPVWAIHDTMVMGRLRDPERLDGHRLESYGVELGILKGSYDGGWDTYNEDTAGRNKAASVKMPERRGKLRWLRDWEEQSLLDALAADADAHSGDMSLQDGYDLTMFLLDTGARYTEVAQVRWDQIELTVGTVGLYRGKVDNEGVLTLPARTLTMLRDRKARLDASGFRYSYVFPRIKGRNWAGVDAPRGHATRLIQRHVDGCGLNNDPTADKVTPHTFRDTFAARLVQAGVSLLKVSKLLGHATVVMTQKYAHLSPEATGAEAAAVLNGLHSSKHPQGDDLIVTPSGHSGGHSSIGHTQRLALVQNSKNPQVLAALEDFLDLMVGRAGVEPTTNGLKVRCSTN